VVLQQSKTPEKKATFWDTLAKTLAGGYVFLGFLLTTLAAFQGGLERLLLNRPYGTLLGLGLVGAGIALAFVDAFVKRASSRKIVVVLALILFIIGLLVLWHVGTSSLADNERPGITATASIAADGSKLEGQVTAFGLKTKQWVYVSVKGLPSATSEAGVPLYKTRAGPGRNGKVDVSFTIPVAFNRFQRVRIAASRVGTIDEEKNDPCFESPDQQPQTKDTEPVVDQSCATIFPPSGQTRPTLNATWETSGASTNVISASVKASGVDPDSFVLVDMAGNSKSKKGNRRVIFYRSIFSSSPTGVVDVTAKAPMPKGMKRACVVATTISVADGTPLEAQPTRICALGLRDMSRTAFSVITVP
jgi:hypothetical protein